MAATAQQQSGAASKHESDVIGTLMSLTVAFTLAMAFRGFVLEGFVIPTGSMGPTLMGAHIRVDSLATGSQYACDSSVLMGPHPDAFPQIDPMISQIHPIGTMLSSGMAQNVRAGDRVLVLKPLFLVSEPKRWDVIVFKNPTDPIGETQNYIKRLVGLPNETFLILDGDVFAGAPTDASDQLRIQRKPEYVQRAVWQPIYDSDYEPAIPAQLLDSAMRRAWPGPPWRPTEPSSAQWTMAPHRAWEFAGAGRTALEWNTEAWPILDWNSYDVLRHLIEAEEVMQRARASGGAITERQAYEGRTYAVKDLRLTAVVECADMEHFRTELLMRSGLEKFRFSLGGNGTAFVERSDFEEGGRMLGRAEYAFKPSADGSLSFEFWHVDQQFWIFVNGSLVGTLPYEYDQLRQRISATSDFGRTLEQYLEQPTTTGYPGNRGPAQARLTWSFESAAPFSLHRVRVDRDLYYRPAEHHVSNQTQVNSEGGGRSYLTGPAFGTDWNAPAKLGPDDFLMMGDNSAYSRDGRLWGHEHELARRTFGDSQPGVVPRAMIVGKAWAVYFPAPLPMTPGGTAFIPDFGRLRFIR